MLIVARCLTSLPPFPCEHRAHATSLTVLLSICSMLTGTSTLRLVCILRLLTLLHRPEPRRPAGAGDCEPVQDRPPALREHSTRVDEKVSSAAPRAMQAQRLTSAPQIRHVKRISSPNVTSRALTMSRRRRPVPEWALGVPRCSSRALPVRNVELVRLAVVVHPSRTWSFVLSIPPPHLHTPSYPTTLPPQHDRSRAHLAPTLRRAATHMKVDESAVRCCVMRTQCLRTVVHTFGSQEKS
jgi:hypothetical protein